MMINIISCKVRWNCTNKWMIFKGSGGCKNLKNVFISNRSQYWLMGGIDFPIFPKFISVCIIQGDEGVQENYGNNLGLSCAKLSLA